MPKGQKEAETCEADKRNADRKPTLEALVQAITDESRHDETDCCEPVSNEHWSSFRTDLAAATIVTGFAGGFTVEPEINQPVALAFSPQEFVDRVAHQGGNGRQRFLGDGFQCLHLLLCEPYHSSLHVPMVSYGGAAFHRTYVVFRQPVVLAD